MANNELTPDQIEAQKKAEAEAKRMKQEEDEKKAASQFKFFKSVIAGLTLNLPPSETDPTAVTNERFTPYYERINGDDTKVGYLKTKDPRTIKMCEEDFNCTAISAKEYKDGTTEVFDDDGTVRGARRAAF